MSYYRIGQRIQQEEREIGKIRLETEFIYEKSLRLP